jgi:hypothetical protein
LVLFLLLPPDGAQGLLDVALSEEGTGMEPGDGIEIDRARVTWYNGEEIQESTYILG